MPHLAEAAGRMADHLAERLSPLPAGLPASDIVMCQQLRCDFCAKCDITVSRNTCGDTSAHTLQAPDLWLMTQPVSIPSANRPTVRVHGQLREYQERRRIGRRDDFLLEPIGPLWRQRSPIFDLRSEPGGDSFQVQRLPAGWETERWLRALRRLKEDHFPPAWEWQPRREGVDIVINWTPGVPPEEDLGHVRAGRRPPIDLSYALRLVGGLAGEAGRAEFWNQAKGSLGSSCQLTGMTARLPRSLHALLDEVTLRRSAFDPHERSPDRPAWTNTLFAASARFRLAPAPSPPENDQPAQREPRLHGRAADRLRIPGDRRWGDHARQPTYADPAFPSKFPS